MNDSIQQRDALYMLQAGCAIYCMLHPVVGCGMCSRCCILWSDAGCILYAASCGEMQMHYMCCILWWDLGCTLHAGCALHVASCGGMWDALYMLHPVVGCGMCTTCCNLWWDAECA